MDETPKTATMPIGVLLRRSPGVTRWVAQVWTLAGIVPHAPPADWTPLRDDGTVAEFHAATLTLELHRKDTDSLIQNLTAQVPSVWVALRGAGRPEPVKVTASPFEASFHEIDAEDRVEKVAMPAGMVEWVEAFVALHHVDEPFVKRRRDKHREGAAQDGIGDARIAQGADVWRNPQSLRGRR
ncbi:DUF3305 domain-containing protein [Jannaschia sp. S6380]|uniref:DUF3305 domain-containing protein n=1 Tax=Jannaschia sp. S6380 TaxID=2926408 RepID=UPI001FF0E5E0|nr:DUF3305 domain-containing protein [Jannaschia sp. S6380]MCK0168332.1 DUF3305 domain-containing protein [Jannaschia sp. S6380]